MRLTGNSSPRLRGGGMNCPFRLKLLFAVVMSSIFTVIRIALIGMIIPARLIRRMIRIMLIGIAVKLALGMGMP